MNHCNKLYKHCDRCKGTGKIKLANTKLNTPDVKRLLRIMKKHSMTQLSLAKILEMSQGTINGWFYAKSNPRGKIKKLHFNILKIKGYE
jgi:DNA-binding transcriptional regulator YiaG